MKRCDERTRGLAATRIGTECPAIVGETRTMHRSNNNIIRFYPGDS